MFEPGFIELLELIGNKKVSNTEAYRFVARF